MGLKTSSSLINLTNQVPPEWYTGVDYMVPLVICQSRNDILPSRWHRAWKQCIGRWSSGKLFREWVISYGGRDMLPWIRDTLWIAGLSPSFALSDFPTFWGPPHLPPDNLIKRKRKGQENGWSWGPHMQIDRFSEELRRFFNTSLEYLSLQMSESLASNYSAWFKVV